MLHPRWPPGIEELEKPSELVQAPKKPMWRAESTHVMSFHSLTVSIPLILDEIAIRDRSDPPFDQAKEASFIFGQHSSCPGDRSRLYQGDDIERRPVLSEHVETNEKPLVPRRVIALHIEYQVSLAIDDVSALVALETTGAMRMLTHNGIGALLDEESTRVLERGTRIGVVLVTAVDQNDEEIDLVPDALDGPDKSHRVERIDARTVPSSNAEFMLGHRGYADAVGPCLADQDAASGREVSTSSNRRDTVPFA